MASERHVPVDRVHNLARVGAPNCLEHASKPLGELVVTMLSTTLSRWASASALLMADLSHETPGA